MKNNKGFQHGNGMKKSIIYILFIMIQGLVLTALSCTKEMDQNPAEKPAPDPGIHETAEKGPAALMLDIERKEITIADRLNLILTIEIDEDYEIKLPAFGENLEQFGIVDYSTSQPELTGNRKKRISRRYLLEPFLSGEYKIPSMEIEFFRQGEDKTHTIETPEALIRVKSLLPDDLVELKLNEIIPPQPLPRSHRNLVIISLSLLVLIAALLFTIHKLRRRRKRDVEAVRLSAHEMAYDEIRRLVGEGLVEKGEIKQFYQRISDILRRYIENRFGLNAPEQTTEEFLSGLENNNTLSGDHKLLLKDFLRHCDLVKFAKYEPAEQDIQNTFDSCRAFIQGTEEKE